MLRPLANCVSRNGSLLVRSSLGSQCRGPKLLTTATRKECSQNTENASTKGKPETDEQAAAPDQISSEELKKAIAEKDSVINDLKEKYQRALADNENIKMRGIKQAEDARLFGIQGFSKDLLEVADILEKATLSIPEQEIGKNVHLKSLFEGLELTGAQLQKVFIKNGLERLDPVDEKFDPFSHEALFQQPFPGKENGTVAVVTKVGYKLHGRTLRPALVGVVKNA